MSVSLFCRVIRRVGGLEVFEPTFTSIRLVIRRVGGLEDVCVSFVSHYSVIRRVGGLEVYGTSAGNV